MIKRVDEFDGVSDAEIVDFSIDGVEYEIDLSQENKDRLYKDLDKYIQAGRRKTAVQSTRKSAHKAPTRKPAVENTANNDAIRHWAKSVGKTVSDRGRIPKDIIEAFDEAHAPGTSAKMFSAATS